ncbi:MAG: potassium-transporting ATPase subunit KdpC [Planctomycetes bacterium]|nr:potassium-transporting ATPase subunit KdpC [Planctomycetota bacterium]
MRAAAVLFLSMTVITGIVYPLVVTVVAQVASPQASTGSLIHDGDRIVGSDLIGQPFDDARYFWGRPSATTPAYNGLGGSGSNLATTNPALRAAVQERTERLRAADKGNTLPIPVDLVSASASGLDPHLSPSAANYQAARVARERGIPLQRVRELIKTHTQPPMFGFLGQPRVHILRLNRSLDAVK